MKKLTCYQSFPYIAAAPADYSNLNHKLEALIPPSSIQSFGSGNNDSGSAFSLNQYSPLETKSRALRFGERVSRLRFYINLIQQKIVVENGDYMLVETNSNTPN